MRTIIFKITGDGYFVFDGLSCMQKGEHVENPFHAESTAALENNNSKHKLRRNKKQKKTQPNHTKNTSKFNSPTLFRTQDSCGARVKYCRS